MSGANQQPALKMHMSVFGNLGNVRASRRASERGKAIDRYALARYARRCT